MIVTHDSIAYMTIIRVFNHRSMTEIWSAVDGMSGAVFSVVTFRHGPPGTHLSHGPCAIVSGTALDGGRRVRGMGLRRQRRHHVSLGTGE